MRVIIRLFQDPIYFSSTIYKRISCIYLWFEQTKNSRTTDENVVVDLANCFIIYLLFFFVFLGCAVAAAEMKKEGARARPHQGGEKSR